MSRSVGRRTIWWGSAVFLTLLLQTAAADCPEDFSGDGQIDGADLAILAKLWGQPALGMRFDLDEDGRVWMGDLNALAAVVGLRCVSISHGTRDWHEAHPCYGFMVLRDMDERFIALRPGVSSETLMRPPVRLVCTATGEEAELPPLSDEFDGVLWWCEAQPREPASLP